MPRTLPLDAERGIQGGFPVIPSTTPCHSERPMSFRASHVIPSGARNLPPSGALHNLVIPTKVGIQMGRAVAAKANC